jgi:phage-related protein (TIGR01555 family)
MNVPKENFSSAGPIFDTLSNLVSGLGTSKDPTTYAQFIFNPLTHQDVEFAYRADWVARKVIDIPPADATRSWRDWQAKNSQIEAIEEVERDLKIQAKVKKALQKARLYGGSVAVMGIDGAGHPEEPLKLERVKRDSLKYVHVLSRVGISTGRIIDDLDSPWYGEPEYYERRSRDGKVLRIHPSRVARFIGAEYPEPEHAPDAWGDSVLQSLLDTIRRVELVSGGIATMVNDAKLDVIKIPRLSEALATTDSTNKLLSRFAVANKAKSTVNTLLLDTQEEWERITTSFGGMSDIMHIYLVIASGACDIPATRMLGQAPSGLHSTGQSDTRNYYDAVGTRQATEISPELERLDDVIIRTAVGAATKSIYYEWTPLWQMNEEEKANLSLKKSQSYQIDVNLGLINDDVLREIRINQLIEDGTYPGIEAAIDEYGAEPAMPTEDPHTGLMVDPKTKIPLPGQTPPTDPNAAGGGNDQGGSAGQPLTPKSSNVISLFGTKKKTGDAFDPDQPRDPEGKWVLNAALHREGHTRAVAGENHGRLQTLAGKGEKKRTDLTLYRGTNNPKEFGTIKSVVVSNTTKGQGNVQALALSEHHAYKLTTPHGETTHTTIKSAMQRAEFERQLHHTKKKTSDAFDPDLHPHVPSGPAGGQFASKGGEGDDGEDDNTDDDKVDPKKGDTSGGAPSAEVIGDPTKQKVPNDPHYTYLHGTVGDVQNAARKKKLTIPEDTGGEFGSKEQSNSSAQFKIKTGGPLNKAFGRTASIPGKANTSGVLAQPALMRAPNTAIDTTHTESGGVRRSTTHEIDTTTVEYLTPDGKWQPLVRSPSTTKDAEPRTLYVRRDVVNASDIIAWAKSVGFETTIPAEDMHVTVAFSRAPVDWMKMNNDWGGNDDKGQLTVRPGGPRMVDRLGQQGEAVVLLFGSSDLSWRWKQFCEIGASWDWPDYNPHITISWQAPTSLDVSKIEPYRGEIVLGPEIFEEVKENWKASITEDANPNHYPAGEKGGQFAPGNIQGGKEEV